MLYLCTWLTKNNSTFVHDWPNPFFGITTTSESSNNACSIKLQRNIHDTKSYYKLLNAKKSKQKHLNICMYQDREVKVVHVVYLEQQADLCIPVHKQKENRAFKFFVLSQTIFLWKKSWAFSTLNIVPSFLNTEGPNFKQKIYNVITCFLIYTIRW
jgi:hypothetical protein